MNEIFSELQSKHIFFAHDDFSETLERACNVIVSGDLNLAYGFIAINHNNPQFRIQALNYFITNFSNQADLEGETDLSKQVIDNSIVSCFSPFMQEVNSKEFLTAARYLYNQINQSEVPFIEYVTNVLDSYANNLFAQENPLIKMNEEERLQAIQTLQNAYKTKNNSIGRYDYYICSLSTVFTSSFDIHFQILYFYARQI